MSTRSDCIDRLKHAASGGDDRAKALLCVLERHEECGIPAKARVGRWRVELWPQRMCLFYLGEPMAQIDCEDVHSAALRLWQITIGRRSE